MGPQARLLFLLSLHHRAILTHVNIQRKLWSSYHSGLVFGILGAAFGGAVGYYPAAILTFIAALNGGNIYASFIILLLIPIAITLFIGIKVHNFHNDDSEEFTAGVLQSSCITIIIVFFAVLGWMGHRDSVRHEEARVAQLLEEDRLNQSLFQLRAPHALENLTPPLSPLVEKALRLRVKENNLTPEMMRLVVRKFPIVSCDVVSNPNVTADVLDSIYELKSCDTDPFLKNPSTSNETLQSIQDSNSSWVSAEARKLLAQRSCDQELLKEDADWALEQKAQAREEMELVLVKHPCSPMSVFADNEDFTRKDTDLYRRFAQRTFPGWTPAVRIAAGTPFEPQYIVTQQGEVLDKYGIEYLAKRSCDPKFLSYLVRAEAGPVDHTDDPFPNHGWFFSGMDFALIENVCTPEEVHQRILRAATKGTTIGELVAIRRRRKEARKDPNIAKSQDWKDTDCLVRGDGICKKYLKQLHPPKGFKEIGPGYEFP